MDDSTDNVTVVASTVVFFSAIALLLRPKPRRKRRWWMVSLFKSRNRYDGSSFLTDIRREPSGLFENFCRMTATDFDYLLNKISPRIAKENTLFRKAIPPHERLAITLRFLTTGDSYVSLSYLFKVSNQLISKIVPEVCNALIDALKDEIKLPDSHGKWLEIAKNFKERWNFPHCVGALDGKHVLLQAPCNSESMFYNYKNTFSVILMALVDANYCFTFVDVGSQGRMNDSAVYRSTTLYKKLIKNELKLPPSEPLKNRTVAVPYVVIADDAFHLSPNLMKAFAGNPEKCTIERIYNYRHCRARRIVENVFGIMASVFRVLRHPMLLQPDTAALVTMTCALLHNFLRKSRLSGNVYSPRGTFDSEIQGELIPGSWRQDTQPTSLLPLQRQGRRSSDIAKALRLEIAEYFVTDGAIEWQETYQ